MYQKVSVGGHHGQCLVTVGVPFDEELEHGNPLRKGSTKPLEDGRWSNDHRLAGGKATIAGPLLPVDDLLLP